MTDDTHPRTIATRIGAKVYSSPRVCERCDTQACYTSNGRCVECDYRAKKARLADPIRAASAQAKNRARVAASRARRKAAAGQPDDFADVLG